MKYGKWLDGTVWVGVIALHVSALLLLLQTSPPQLVIGEPGMQLVSLGDLNIGQAQQAAPIHNPLPPPVPEKKLLTIKHPTKKADLVDKTKPKPPLRQPETAAITEKKQPETSNTNGEGNTNRTTTGGSNAGNGQAETLATHQGGHLHNPKPPYPPLSIENSEQGSVRLRVTVEADGHPSSVELAQSSGYSRLDNSALKTVRNQYRFTPATRMGIPVQSVYTFNIVFKLNER